MLILVAIAALALLAFGITLIVRGVSSGGAGTSDTVTQIGAYGFSGTATAGTTATGEPFSLRASLDRLAAWLGANVGRRLSRLGERELRERLVSAGMYTSSPGRIFGYQFILAVGLVLAWLFLAQYAGIGSLLYIGGAIVVGLAGWIAPLAYIDYTRRKRFETIEYDLPDLIDLLVVTIEAGLSFTASLRMAADRLSGPLAQELRLTLQEQAMGLTLTESLQNLVRRADTGGIRSFVRAMTQGEQLGVSTGQIMRTLADEMRKRRKAAAEERAQKAPIKMLFPLLIFIFPAMFVVILMPAILSIADALK
jgi:tight adherence protein C